MSVFERRSLSRHAMKRPFPNVATTPRFGIGDLNNAATPQSGNGQLAFEMLRRVFDRIELRRRRGQTKRQFHPRTVHSGPYGVPFGQRIRRRRADSVETLRIAQAIRVQQ